MSPNPSLESWEIFLDFTDIMVPLFYLCDQGLCFMYLCIPCAWNGAWHMAFSKKINKMDD